MADEEKVDWKWQSAEGWHAETLSHEERLRINEKYKDYPLSEEPGVTHLGPPQYYPFDEKLPLTKDPAD
jgi:hypothetical protein